MWQILNIFKICYFKKTTGRSSPAVHSIKYQDPTNIKYAQRQKSHSASNTDCDSTIQRTRIVQKPTAVPSD